jgi:hypothetical protein
MGNRGVLHDAEGRIKRAWQVKRWIVCVLEFRDRRRTVMTPNSYTELFFLDEATALAAGHRPCSECRHGRFLDFCTAWKIANPKGVSLQRPTADEIDNCLHAERLTPDRSKRLFLEDMDDLPDGVFVKLEESSQEAFLVWDGSLLTWSPGGYHERRPRPRKGKVWGITPPSTVKVIRTGYIPAVHASAGDSVLDVGCGTGEPFPPE